KHCSPCPVPENYGNTSSASGHVKAATVVLTSNHQHVLVHSGLYKLVGYGKGINKATTLVSHVKCGTGMDVKHLLYLHPGSWEIVIRTQGGENDQIDVVFRYSGSLQRNPGGLGPHDGSGISVAFFDVSAFFYSGPLLNPGIVGVHHHGEIVVSHHIFWHITTQAGYFRLIHFKLFRHLSYFY